MSIYMDFIGENPKDPPIRSDVEALDDIRKVTEEMLATLREICEWLKNGKLAKCERDGHTWWTPAGTMDQTPRCAECGKIAL